MTLLWLACVAGEPPAVAPGPDEVLDRGRELLVEAGVETLRLGVHPILDELGAQESAGGR